MLARSASMRLTTCGVGPFGAGSIFSPPSFFLSKSINLDAYDLYLRALPHMMSMTPADARIAEGFLKDALKLDPDYPGAHALIAWCNEICYIRGERKEADRIAGLRHARLAIASGTDDATALAVAAFALGILSKDYKTAVSVIERALSLNPSSAAAHYWGAIIHASSGNFAAVTGHANRALRLSPFDPLAFLAQIALGHVALVEGHYDEAASHYAKSVLASPRFIVAYFCQAIALALAGRVEEASPIVRLLLELNPGFRSSKVFDYSVIGTFATKLMEGARLLGLPE
jgi:adenylate cyclase